MVSDFGHPRTRGGGGVKKGQIFADVLYGWPLTHSLATLGRALYLNSTLAIARVLFKHDERYAHVML